jgi:tetratricopeptide (TPR) repeat protein
MLSHSQHIHDQPIRCMDENTDQQAGDGPSQDSRLISKEYIDIEKGKSYRHQINIDNLINICTLKLKKNSAHKKALFIRSSSYMKKGKYAEAVEDAHSLLNIDSRNVGAYFILGSAHEKMG